MGDIDFRFYLSIFLKRLPLFFLIAVSILTIGLAAALFTPPLYRASARILVEDPQISADMVRPTVSTNAIAQLQVIEQEITTRENLLALAERMNVYAARKTKLADADIVDNMRSRISFEQLQLNTGEGRGATIFNVSFEARDPALAARVVNELVTFILNKNMDLRTSRAGDTMQFFDQEVKRLGGILTKLEAQILDFKNANKEALPDSLDFRRNQQSAQQERLLLLEREEAGLRTRRTNLVQMFETTGKLMNAGPVSPDQQMLQDLNRALSEQLAIFAEGSPNVVTLQTRIAALQKKIQTGQDQKQNGKAGPSELDLQLSEIDERLAFISRERSSITAYLSELEKSIAATPHNETLLNSLERQRANTQTQYTSMVARLGEASAGEQIEKRSKGGRFSVVEPATAPTDPVSPNRKSIAGLGIAGGFACGLGLVVLLELLNRSIRRPSELAQVLQAQPLATIPYIWVAGEKQDKYRKMAVGCAIAAITSFIFLAALHFYRTPLRTVFEAFLVAIDSSWVL